ncbi:50S ribosomal protein L1 [Patescibacteria group bacterium]
MKKKKNVKVEETVKIEKDEKIDKNKAVSIDEAVKIIKEAKKAKFDESVEIHIKLGIDPKKGDQMVRSTAVLPHGIGKTKKIAVITADDNQKEAQNAGADIVGGKEMIEKIKTSGKVNFDVLVATADVMKDLAKIAKILGPRGLMPSPKNETITNNISKTVEELKKGKISFKNDDTSNIHQIIGKISFTENQLVENFKAFIDEIKKAKPSSSKGTYMKNIVICSTMGKGVRVNV